MQIRSLAYRQRYGFFEIMQIKKLYIQYAVNKCINHHMKRFNHAVYLNNCRSY